MIEVPWILVFAETIVSGFAGLAVLSSILEWRSRPKKAARIPARASANVQRLEAIRGKVLAPRPATAVEQLLAAKKEIREDESARWFEAWERAAGLPDRRAVLEDVKLVEIRAKEAKWSPEMRARENERRRQYNRQYAQVRHTWNGEVKVPYWDGQHLTDCPTNCDCPTWARRRP